VVMNGRIACVAIGKLVYVGEFCVYVMTHEVVMCRTIVFRVWLVRIWYVIRYVLFRNILESTDVGGCAPIGQYVF
jgi:hypothetical protein